MLEFFNALRDIHCLYKQKGSQYESILDEIFSTYSFVNQCNVFNTTWVKKLSERRMLPQECRVKYIMPLVSLDGLLYITDERIYVQPKHPVTLGKSVVNLKLTDVRELFKRRYTLMEIGIEIVAHKLKDNKLKKKSMYLVFDSFQQRNYVYSLIFKLVSKTCITTEQDISSFTQQWQQGELSNFDYLMLLNSYAQRSMNDLTQYPVMPWIIKEYKAPFIDLNDPKIYRDLSKPIGAMDAARLAEFRQRYDDTPDGADKFLYGSHFSCPGYVIGFHVRSQP